MAEYIYPANDYDKARNLLALLGSHWSNVYHGNELVETYAFARAQEEIQTYQDILETVASVSRLEVPIYHTDNWYFLTIRESDLNERTLKYGDGAVYGTQADGSVYVYGEANIAVEGVYYAFPLPTDLKDVNLVLNRLTEPSLSWVKGTDYFLDTDEGYIYFRENPFSTGLFAERDIIEEGEVTDSEIGMWLFRAQFDWEHTYQHFGYLLGLRLASSREYRDLVNAILDAFVKGTAEEHLRMALSAITGVPVVIEAEETVELVQTDHNHLVIATDHNVYKFPTAANATVTVGDTVYAGDWLVDLVQTYELNRGEVPEGVDAITMGVAFLPGGFVDGLTFKNEEVALDVETVGGVTKVSFELGGFPTDVDAFWDLVHDRGLEETTLARYLDVRGTDADDEPQTASLPSTINPLEFLIENVLRYNAFVVKIKASKLDSAISLSTTRLLRKVIPPWTCMIVLLEIEVDGETIVLEGEGSETEPGYTESITTGSGMEPVTESIDPATYIEETISIRAVNGTCR